MYQHLPNAISCLRIILGFALAYLIVIQATIPAILTIIVGSWSDFFDGYAARKLQIKSEWGAFLDPLADKLFIAAAFTAFWYVGLVAWWVVAVVVVRDSFITLMRSLLLSRGTPMRTVWIAKCKTVLQLGALYVLIIAQAVLSGMLGAGYLPYHGMIIAAIYYLGVLVAGSTIVTGLVYLPQLFRTR